MLQKLSRGRSGKILNSFMIYSLKEYGLMWYKENNQKMARKNRPSCINEIV